MNDRKKIERKGIEGQERKLRKKRNIRIKRQESKKKKKRDQGQVKRQTE